jgi:hypothetical protein
VSRAKARVESLSYREYGYAGDVIHRGHASARGILYYKEAILACLYVHVHMPTLTEEESCPAQKHSRVSRNAWFVVRWVVVKAIVWPSRTERRTALAPVGILLQVCQRVLR